jgi:predicted enzyme related to lactoylglutathione lyase
MSTENRIDYIEIPVTDPAKARDFFTALFGWTSQDWGPDYISFNDGRLEGGFRRSEEPAPGTGVLLVFFSEDLERDRDRVVKLGATISQDIFPFPGGRRFHFIDPVGSEFAIWSAVIEEE